MTAAFLPSILVPIVGIIFPALSMALFFIYTQIDDIA
jgi:photosystem I subunit 8|nr:photosystem I reaction center subunit VIII [Guinardia striata]